MLKKDLADKKGLNFILLVFMCFASVLTVASAVLLYANTLGVSENEDRVNAADLFMIVERDMDGMEERRENALNWFRDRDDVVDVELGQTIVLNPNAVDFEPIEEDDYSRIVHQQFYAFDLSAEHDKVTDMDSNFFELPYGTVAVPMYLHTLTGIETGDKLRISTQMGNIYEFTIAAFTKDPAMDDYSRLFFNSEDYQILLNESPVIGDVYYVDLTEGAQNVDIISVAADFNGMKDDLGNTVMYASLKGYSSNEQVSTALNALILIMSIFLIIMVFMTVTYTIKTAIKSEEKELGMLKALGVESVSFNWLFASKYLALSLVGSVVGYFGGIFLAGLYVKYVSPGMLMPRKSALVTTAGISSVMIFLLIVLFVSIALKRMKKISIMDVIAGENRGERFKALPGFFLHKIKNINIPLYLALTDLLTKIKRYSFLIISYLIGFAICMTVLEVNETTNSAYFIEHYWRRAHFDFAIDLPDDVMEEYITRGGNIKGAYDIINKELQDAGIPATVDYFQFLTEDPKMIHDGETYECIIQFNNPYSLSLDMYEGVRPELPNEVAINAYHAMVNGIEIGDTITLEYNRYNEDGISYDRVSEDYIVTGTFDAPIVYLTALMSESFDGAADSNVALNGCRIDAPDEDKPMYIEQMRDMYGQASVRDRDEEVQYQLRANSTMFTMMVRVVIPVICFMMALVTVLYLSLNILDEVPEIALLKCSGFGTGTIKAWQILRILLILLFSTLLGILTVRTIMKVFLKFVFSLVGYTVGY
ncbi:MAG: ABC transporter permease [Clostridiales bacterium]|nr:ABC transporter permease [Clostridiales bacterium]